MAPSREIYNAGEDLCHDFCFPKLPTDNKQHHHNICTLSIGAISYNTNQNSNIVTPFKAQMATQRSSTPRSKRKTGGELDIMLEKYLKQLVNRLGRVEDIQRHFRTPSFLTELRSWKRTCFDAEGHRQWLLNE